MNAAAVKLQKEVDEKGEAEAGMLELDGDCWYIAETSKPRAPLATTVKLRKRAGRRLSSIPMTMA